MAKRILVIDDDVDFTEAMTTLLDAKGYEVDCAHNGEEGFANAKKYPPQLIILDVMMTRKTEGFDVARNLKEDAATRSIPVVLITGIRKEMNLPFGFEPDNDWLPVRAVLEKPVKPETLLKVIEENIA